MNKKNQKGLTLIELLIGLAMTVSVFLLTTQVVISLLSRTTKDSRVETLEQTGNDIQTDLNNAIKWAEKVDFVNGVLEVDGTTFELVDGAILKDGVRLTSNDVKVTSFEVFKRTESESSGEGGSGIGLNAEYYNTKDFTGDVIEQIDFEVDFFWGTDPPHPQLNANNVSIRWTGQVETVGGGQYTFYTQSDDGSRLWVNGQLVVDNWGYHGMGAPVGGKITLEGDSRYDLVLEYFESGNTAGCRLMWSHGEVGQEIIPTEYLYPTAAKANLEVLIGVEHVEDPSLTDNYRIILTPRSGVVGAVYPAPTATPTSEPNPTVESSDTPRPTASPTDSPTPTGESRPTLPSTATPTPEPTPTPKPLR